MLSFLLTVGISVASAATSEWNIDLDAKTTPFYYYWNQGVGSGHAALMTRSDWQQYMKNGHDTIGFNQVRGHGLFDDDVGSVNGNNDFSFINIDKIYQYLLSIGMKPYVELSFMPDLFKSTDTTICHYKGNTSPPKDYNQWYNFIKAFAQHLVDEFGIDEVSTWNYEVWNEPNDNFWSGNPKYNTYLELYNATARAIKSVSDKLKVGGPVVNMAGSSWISNFLTYTQTNKVPIDFVVWHSYPKVNKDLQSYIDGIQGVIKTVDQFNSKYNVNLPAFISEYASCCCYPKTEFDDNYSAAFLIYMAQFLQPLFPKQGDSTLKWMSYWAISDVFEEPGFESNEFSGVYGLQTTRGTAKPAFRAMEALAKYGGNISYSGTRMSRTVNDTVMVYTLNNGEKNRFGIFISNFNSKSLPINDATVELYINNNNEGIKSMNSYRIDDSNTNPVDTWKSMKSPEYPSTDQLKQIQAASELSASNIAYKQVNATTATISMDVPVYGVVVLDIQY